MKTKTIYHIFFFLLLLLHFGAQTAHTQVQSPVPVPYDQDIQGQVVQIINDSSYEIFENSKVCVVYVKADGKLFGIVEDYYSCQIARELKNYPDSEFYLEALNLYTLDSIDPELNQTLQIHNPGALYLLYETE